MSSFIWVDDKTTKEKESGIVVVEPYKEKRMKDYRKTGDDWRKNIIFEINIPFKFLNN